MHTLITDYLLGAFTLLLGMLLLRGSGLPTRLWGWGFIASAIAAITGGTWHGFETVLDERALFWIWKATMYLLGVFGLATVCGSIVAAIDGRLRTVCIAAACAVTIAYGVAAATHDAFIYVIAFNAITMAAILVIQVFTRVRHRDPASPWIIAGIAISAVGAAVQASGYSPYALFNNNDLFHVIQAGAMYLFFRGAVLLRSEPPRDSSGRTATAASTSP